MTSLYALWLACAAQRGAPEPTAAPTSTGSSMTITETTQGRLGDGLVGVSNLWERTYALPDGTEKTGLTARLTLDDGSTVAGEGSVVTVAGKTWRVTRVEKPADGRGSVTFEPTTP